LSLDGQDNWLNVTESVGLGPHGNVTQRYNDEKEVVLGIPGALRRSD